MFISIPIIILLVILVLVLLVFASKYNVEPRVKALMEQFKKDEFDFLKVQLKEAATKESVRLAL